MLLALASCTTRRNPDVCCTNDTECAQLGLPPGSANEYGCGPGYACHGFHCMAEAISDAGGDGSPGRCVPELVFQRGGEFFSLANVFRVDLESFDEKPIPSGAMNDFAMEPEWSPDGSKIALSRFTSIVVVDPDGSHLVPVASETDNTLFNLKWSPDGTKIAYTSQPIVGGTSTILAAASNGTGATNLTLGQDSQGPLEWSPDGTQIVFPSKRTGDYEVFKMFADGSSQVNLTNRSGSDGRSGLHWSPDGLKILFIGLNQVWVANTDGSDPKNLTGTIFQHSDAIWSHDGQKIYFVRGSNGTGEIWVMNANGGGQHLLISSGGLDVSPVPSPDGTKIAWASRRDGNYEIYVANIDGSNPVRVTNNDRIDGHPRWRPCR